MKKITAALLLMVSLQATAQDIILKKNGEELKAKVVELTSTDIKYKAEDNPDGPLYNLPKAEVFKIKYSNGKSDFFRAADSKESIATIAPPTTTSSYKYDSLMKKYKDHRAIGILGCVVGPIFLATGTGMVILGINSSSDQGLFIGLGAVVMAGGLTEMILGPLSLGKAKKTKDAAQQYKVSMSYPSIAPVGTTGFMIGTKINF